MEKLINTLYSLAEIGLITTLPPKLLKDTDHEIIPGFFVFTLTPPNNISFNTTLYDLFVIYLDTQKIGISINTSRRLVEFHAETNDEDKLVQVFEEIKQQYEELQQQRVLLTAPLAAPLLVPTPLSASLEPREAIDTLPKLEEAIDTTPEEIEMTPEEQTTVRLQKMLNELTITWGSRTESPKVNHLFDFAGMASKAFKSVKNNTNYYTNGGVAAINLIEKIKPFLRVIDAFPKEELAELLDLLTDRLNHVQQPHLCGIHSSEIATLGSAIGYIVELMPDLTTKAKYLS